MDTNALKEIGYVIEPCCKLCVHSHFPFQATNWGTCSNHDYQHLKHSGPKRELSITKYGRCSKFAASENVAVVLGSYVELFTGSLPEGGQ
jgi:hypothetical protein